MMDNGKIFGKLDWFTCIFYNTSLVKLFEFFRLPEDLLTDFLANAFEQSLGYGSNYVLVFEGVSFYLDFDEFLLLDFDCTKIWEYTFSKIRVDCSGSGLEYLRSLGFKEAGEIETYLNDISNYSGEIGHDFSVTRADFAFDFINYERCPDFVEKLLYWLNQAQYTYDMHKYDPTVETSLTPTGCLNVGRNVHPMKFSTRTGDQHTVYIGTVRSLKLVRFYNKLMQYQKNGVTVKPLPLCYQDIDIKSWFRIEFQTRKKEAMHYLFGFRNFKDILKILFNDYLIRDSHGKPIDFMLELYDWGSLQEIPYNRNFT